MAAVGRCRTPGKLERQDGQQKEKDPATHRRILADSDETLHGEPHGGHTGGGQARAWRDMLPIPAERHPVFLAGSCTVGRVPDALRRRVGRGADGRPRATPRGFRASDARLSLITVRQRSGTGSPAGCSSCQFDFPARRILTNVRPWVGRSAATGRSWTAGSELHLPTWSCCAVGMAGHRRGGATTAFRRRRARLLSNSVLQPRLALAASLQWHRSPGRSLLRRGTVHLTSARSSL